MFAQRFHLEFILSTQAASQKALYNSLIEYGDGLEVAPQLTEESGKGKSFKVHICTEDPTLVFDICSQFGRLKSVKVSEEGRR